LVYQCDLGSFSTKLNAWGRSHPFSYFGRYSPANFRLYIPLDINRSFPRKNDARITDRSGRWGGLTFWPAIRRLISYLVSYSLYLGDLWVLIGNRRQGWHDKIANSYIIYVWDARVGSMFANLIAKGRKSTRLFKNNPVAQE